MGGVGSQAKPLSQGCESGWGSGLQVGRDPKTDSFLSPALPQGPVQGETESREVSLCPPPAIPSYAHPAVQTVSSTGQSSGSKGSLWE